MQSERRQADKWLTRAWKVEKGKLIVEWPQSNLIKNGHDQKMRGRVVEKERKTKPDTGERVEMENQTQRQDEMVH